MPKSLHIPNMKLQKYTYSCEISSIAERTELSGLIGDGAEMDYNGYKRPAYLTNDMALIFDDIKFRPNDLL